MFIAQIDEVDLYDSNGSRINDINSVADYINDVLLNNGDHKRQDNDDDNARYFHIVRVLSYCFNPQIFMTGSDRQFENNKSTFTNSSTSKPLPVYYDVVTPPPKTVA
jgi:hypothetical protein